MKPEREGQSQYLRVLYACACLVGVLCCADGRMKADPVPRRTEPTLYLLRAVSDMAAAGRLGILMLQGCFQADDPSRCPRGRFSLRGRTSVEHYSPTHVRCPAGAFAVHLLPRLDRRAESFTKLED